MIEQKHAQNRSAPTEVVVKLVPAFSSTGHIEQPTLRPELGQVHMTGSDYSIENRRNEDEVWRLRGKLLSLHVTAARQLTDWQD